MFIHNSLHHAVLYYLCEFIGHILEKTGEIRVGVQGKVTEKSWTQGLPPKYSD